MRSTLEALKVASIEEAVQTLGYQETFRIVAQSSFGPFFNRELEVYRLDSGLLWDASLIAASVLEQLCRSSTTDPKTGYVVGLLHAVGKVPLNDFVVQMDFRPMPDLSNSENSVRMEIAMLGHNFGEVGAALLQSWTFPEIITEVIAHQCTPGLAGDPHRFCPALESRDYLGGRSARSVDWRKSGRTGGSGPGGSR